MQHGNGGLRGWSGDKGEGEQRQRERNKGGGGTFEAIFPFMTSAPLIFSLLSGRLVPALLDLSEVRAEIQSADKKLKVAVDHFKRRKCQLLL